MEETFKIFLEQLKSGKIEAIDSTISPNFLAIEEESLQLKDPIHVKGEVYLADDSLILHLDVKTYAIVPCSICNEFVKVPVSIGNFYHVEPIEEITQGFFNYQDVLREAILLEVPAFAECHQGNCPKRSEIKKYLKSKETDSENRPFADINLDQFKP